MAVPKKNTDHFLELLEEFIRLRPGLVVPEHLVQFKDKMEALRGYGRNTPEDIPFLFRVFAVLAHDPAPPTMGELGSALEIPLSSVTRTVDWMVRGGFVERVNDPGDRRVVRVHMTEAGRAFHRASVAYARRRIDRLLADFSPEEQLVFLKLLKKLLDAVSAGR